MDRFSKPTQDMTLQQALGKISQIHARNQMKLDELKESNGFFLQVMQTIIEGYDKALLSQETITTQLQDYLTRQDEFLMKSPISIEWAQFKESLEKIVVENKVAKANDTSKEIATVGCMETDGSPLKENT